jgi:hypothetical protein
MSMNGYEEKKDIPNARRVFKAILEAIVEEVETGFDKKGPATQELLVCEARRLGSGRPCRWRGCWPGQGEEEGGDASVRWIASDNPVVLKWTCRNFDETSQFPKSATPLSHM